MSCDISEFGLSPAKILAAEVLSPHIIKEMRHVRDNKIQLGPVEIHQELTTAEQRLIIAEKL